jgi:hypothetical protein
VLTLTESDNKQFNQVEFHANNQTISKKFKIENVKLTFTSFQEILYVEVD